MQSQAAEQRRFGRIKVCCLLESGPRPRARPRGHGIRVQFTVPCLCQLGVGPSRPAPNGQLETFRSRSSCQECTLSRRAREQGSDSGRPGFQVKVAPSHDRPERVLWSRSGPGLVTRPRRADSARPVLQHRTCGRRRCPERLRVGIRLGVRRRVC